MTDGAGGDGSGSSGGGPNSHDMALRLDDLLARLEDAEAAIRETQARYRSLFDSIDEGFCIVELIFDQAGEPKDYRFLEVNPAFERQTGLTHAVGRKMLELAPAHEAHWAETYGRIARTGTPERFERRAEALGHWYDVYAFPFGPPDRNQVAILFKDVDERRRVEAALRDSEERYRHTVEFQPQVSWTATPEGLIDFMPPRWTKWTGTPGDGDTWTKAVHADDLPRKQRAWEHALKTGEPLDADLRVLMRDGTYRWMRSRAFPQRDADGRIERWYGTTEDIDDRRRAEEEKTLLLAELQHRVRNTLSVIRSIARRTAENSGTVEDFQVHFDGRLSAFGRIQSHVTRDPERGVDLESILADELLAHQARPGERARLQGPDVRLAPKLAYSLGLAIHELVTNAVKYGALADDAGSIDIRWTVDHDGDRRLLRLRWSEDVPSGIAPPRRSGFGTELLHTALAYELDAKTSLDFTPHGLRCTIQLPLVTGNGDRMLLSA